MKTAMTMKGFSDDELRDDRLMEGQRLQLNVVDPSPRRPAAQFARAGVRFSASPSSSPTRSSPARRGRGLLRIAPAAVAQAAPKRQVEEAKNHNNNNNSCRDDKPRTRASTRWLASGYLDGKLGGVDDANRRGRRSRYRKGDKRVELLAATNVRRRAASSAQRGGGGGGSASEGGGISERRDAKTRSDREAEARAKIEEMDRAFRRNTVAAVTRLVVVAMNARDKLIAPPVLLR